MVLRFYNAKFFGVFKHGYEYLIIYGARVVGYRFQNGID